METFTGKRVNPLHMYLDDISIDDIAHSLSLICRFNGQCLQFYSVAEHSIIVADLVHREIYNLSAELYEGGDAKVKKTCLAALLHDGAEAYIGDIVRGLKQQDQYKYIREVEKQIMGMIVTKYNCSPADWDLIKYMDNVMLATEAKVLMPSSGKGWYLPETALRAMPVLPADTTVEQLFLDRFEEYGGKY